MAETGVPPQKTGGGGFNARMAGLPLWGWTAIGAAGAVIVWVWYRNRQQTKANDPNATSQYTPSGNEGLSSEQYNALLAQLRDLQGAQAQDKDTTGSGDNGGDDGDGGGKGKDIRITSDGSKSLNQIAASHHTSAASIVSTTQKHHGIVGKFAAYVKRHHFTVKVPAGVSLWITPETA